MFSINSNQCLLAKIYTYRRNVTPQGNSTILPSEVANLPTETGPVGGVTPPLSAGPKATKQK